MSCPAPGALMAKRTEAKKVRQEYQVFISHATADKGIAILLDAVLRARGIEATFRDDRDIEGGVKFKEQIKKQLRLSRECLILWTPRANESEWVRFEASIADNLDLHIVPLLYETEVKDLLPYLQDRSAVKLQDIEKYLIEV